MICVPIGCCWLAPVWFDDIVTTLNLALAPFVVVGPEVAGGATFAGFDGGGDVIVCWVVLIMICPLPHAIGTAAGGGATVATATGC